MAKAIRRCFKEQTKGSGNWTVGKMCNRKGASKKYASGIATKKPPLNLPTRRQREAMKRGEKPKRIGRGSKIRKDGKRDKRFK